MAIERAGTRFVPKPWGCTDLRPWSKAAHVGGPIGELWFQRADVATPVPTLLLKLLFTAEPLSIQVHPGDKLAKSIGLAHGKSEAWYILAAAPGAEVGLGLKLPLTAAQLRAAIEDGSIEELMQRRPVAKDDFIFVPGGTIHSIGKDIVVAEIQQRSDLTFRLFDFGRGRELDANSAVAAATAEPAAHQPPPTRLSEARCMLLAGPHFVVERLDLPAASSWLVDPGHETWFLVLEGQVRIGPVNAGIGDAVYLDGVVARLEVGADGLKGIVAYPGAEPRGNLIQERAVTRAATLAACA